MLNLDLTGNWIKKSPIFSPRNCIKTRLRYFWYITEIGGRRCNDLILTHETGTRKNLNRKLSGLVNLSIKNHAMRLKFVTWFIGGTNDSGAGSFQTNHAGQPFTTHLHVLILSINRAFFLLSRQRRKEENNNNKKRKKKKLYSKSWERVSCSNKCPIETCS